MIHPTAIIHANAQVDPTVEVGPCAVIDERVTLGIGCVVGPHAFLTGHTVIGAGNRIHAGCVIGDEPQDLKYKNEPTRLIIGDNNVFREHVTVHRSNKMEADTVIGSHNLFMAHSHVGHNVIMGNYNILANGVLLAGHVTLEDRVFLSGNCLLHQFVRVGSLAIMQGGAKISKDLPPFTVAVECNLMCGLNIIGMRRAGMGPELRLELKTLYRELFRSGRNLRESLAAAQSLVLGEPARQMLEFVGASKRGVCSDVGWDSGE